MTKDEINAFLESGIIERYILGETSPSENEQLIELSKKYPEIAKALEESEALLFRILKDGERPVPVGLEKKIFRKLPSERKIYGLKLGIAVASILFSGLLYYTIQKILQYNALNKDYQELKLKCEEMTDEFASVNQAFQVINRENSIRIALQPTSRKDMNPILIWYERQSKMALVSTDHLISLDQGFDYQLWAIIDDIPKSVGIVHTSEKWQLLKIDFSTVPAAFAISIEPAGGSESPTLDKIIAVGSL